ncbi:F0F1 ATP synthase subunit delta [Candidatus Pantoea edessiphila]|uniref:ATP synthase subunit delta n=1 Tax=Candidatus Pantoea edessiphila TaxID=2044610 RepID=A0A2P5T186_9GAMM|nr:F0F1 ATP synthase subunit delta [Candidatus Pantoea edessiphila]PPI88338.1 F0F1 ATP synthase subunit delta [Candidatus Pantoea edessiphila]
MFKLITIARPYAKAIFDFSVENNDVEHWYQMLKLIAEIAIDKEIKKIFPRNLAAQDMYTIFNTICGNKLNKPAKNLIKLMSENKRLHILPIVLNEFIKLRNSYEETKEVNIISAKQLNNKQLADIKNVLEKYLLSKIILKHQIDRSLISGVIIYLDDLVINDSVSGRLSNLAKFLQS